MWVAYNVFLFISKNTYFLYIYRKAKFYNINCILLHVCVCVCVCTLLLWLILLYKNNNTVSLIILKSKICLNISVFRNETENI